MTSSGEIERILVELCDHVDRAGLDLLVELRSQIYQAVGSAWIAGVQTDPIVVKP